MNFLKRLFKKENNNVTELYLSLLDYNIIPPSNDFYNTEDNLILPCGIYGKVTKN